MADTPVPPNAPSVTARRRTLTTARIVGVGESDEIGTVPGASSLGLANSAIHNALRDAGIAPDEVDGLFTARMGPLTLAEYAGLRPSYSDGTWIGGNSFVSHLVHAAGAIAGGLCSVALVVHGQAGRSAVRPPLVDAQGLPHGNVIDSPDPNQPSLDYELPHGIIGAPVMYALSAQRYCHDHGADRSRRAFCSIARASREWAALTPRAQQKAALSDAEYFASPEIASPLRGADCCLVSDGGVAAVLVGRDHKAAQDRPVVMTGAAEAMTHAMISQMPALTTTATALTAPAALAMAGRGLEAVDVTQTYDAFTYSTLIGLEDMGYCGKGQGPDFVADTGIGPDGGLALNTNGGGLSYAHTGMYGGFLLAEAVRQVRGEAPAQVPGARIALLNAHGGLLSAATTMVLEAA